MEVEVKKGAKEKRRRRKTEEGRSKIQESSPLFPVLKHSLQTHPSAGLVNGGREWRPGGNEIIY